MKIDKRTEKAVEKRLEAFNEKQLKALKAKIIEEYKSELDLKLYKALPREDYLWAQSYRSPMEPDSHVLGLYIQENTRRHLIVEKKA